MITANMKGLAAFQQRIEQLSKQEATKAGQVANRAGAAILKKEIIKTAPNSPKTTEGEKRTRHNKGGTTREETHGKIVNHVGIKKTKSNDPTKVQNSVFIDGKAYHASFVEFGSINNAADPFMLEALRSAQQPIIDTLAKVLNKRLIKAGV